MKHLIAAIVCMAAFGHAQAQGAGIAGADSAPAVLAAQKGKRITVRLRSGQEMSGTVRESSERLLVLGEVSGREFFDAAIPVDAIEAILVRTKP